MDRPLYSEGVVDQQATKRRDELADRLCAEAKQTLG